MSSNPLFIIAVRTRSSVDDTVEVLCLRYGDTKRFRIYSTSVDEGLREPQHGLEPIEFDTPSNADVSIFLIESFWRLEISETDIAVSVDLLERCSKTDEPHRAEDPSATSPLSILLVQLLDQLRVMKPTDVDALDLVRRHEQTLQLLQKVPFLPSTASSTLAVTYAAVVGLRRSIEDYATSVGRKTN